jgi:hypothetical protein
MSKEDLHTKLDSLPIEQLQSLYNDPLSKKTIIEYIVISDRYFDYEPEKYPLSVWARNLYINNPNNLIDNNLKNLSDLAKELNMSLNDLAQKLNIDNNKPYQNITIQINDSITLKRLTSQLKNKNPNFSQYSIDTEIKSHNLFEEIINFFNIIKEKNLAQPKELAFNTAYDMPIITEKSSLIQDNKKFHLNQEILHKILSYEFITELNLINYNINLKTAKIITSNNKLKNIGLNHSEITTKALKEILSLNLGSIDLASCNLNDKHYKIIKDAIEDGNIGVFSLSKNNFSYKNLVELNEVNNDKEINTSIIIEKASSLNQEYIQYNDPDIILNFDYLADILNSKACIIKEIDFTDLKIRYSDIVKITSTKHMNYTIILDNSSNFSPLEIILIAKHAKDKNISFEFNKDMRNNLFSYAMGNNDILPIIIIESLFTKDDYQQILTQLKLSRNDLTIEDIKNKIIYKTNKEVVQLAIDENTIKPEKEFFLNESITKTFLLEVMTNKNITTIDIRDSNPDFSILKKIIFIIQKKESTIIMPVDGITLSEFKHVTSHLINLISQEKSINISNVMNNITFDFNNDGQNQIFKELLEKSNNNKYQNIIQKKETNINGQSQNL